MPEPHDKQDVRPDWPSAPDLEAGYRAMAADEDRERDEFEWIESGPDDALPPRT